MFIEDVVGVEDVCFGDPFRKVLVRCLLVTLKLVSAFFGSPFVFR